MGITSIYVMLSVIIKFASTETGECGIKKSSSRIVGGRDSGGYHYPWFALLVLKNNEDIPICAGSLITPRHVLTAAHCFKDKSSIPKEDFYNVLMGVYNRCNHNEPNRQIFTVSNVFVHEEYDPKNKFYDIAVLTISRPADFTVICLPFGTGGNDESEPAVLIGFGVTKEGGRKAPCHLMEAHITKYSKTDCKRSDLPEDDIQEETVICAGRILGGIDSCQGDSGGPLLTVTSTGKYIITGIVSYGYGCANPGLPGLYTNVASYLDWIEDKISGSKIQKQNFHTNSKEETGGTGLGVTFPDRRIVTARHRKLYTSGGTVRFPGQNSTWKEHFKNFRETEKMSTVFLSS